MSGGHWGVDRRQRHNGKWVRLIPSDEPAPTLTVQGGSQWIMRSLDDWDDTWKPTRRMLEKIMGFPEVPWVGNKTSVRQQMGNAVPPAVAAAVVREAMGVRSDP